MTAAVDATAGEVALYEGKVITAFFHSTSGGRTADVVRGRSARPVPYLVSVDDPWSSLSPYNRWGPTPLAEAAIRKGLGLRSPVARTEAHARALWPGGVGEGHDRWPARRP